MICKTRSANVDLPWSMCAMMEKLRMWANADIGQVLYRSGEPPKRKRRPVPRRICGGRYGYPARPRPGVGLR
ncbi:MAG: hypothetical protein Kow00122_10190 [Thermoleophilia bacterium]